MKQWKLYSALFLIFLAGLITGAVGTGLYNRQRQESLQRGGYPTVIRNIILDRLTRELGLEAGQRREVETVILETQAGLKELRNRYRPEAEALIAQGIVKMKGRLSAGQQARLDQLIAQERQRRTANGK
ncbi:MAG: hypothetical protein HY892_05480 [Deltaproteobacteria bacterium]|nr:hypothetical protein [Deltaproteobacteria bacterium]